MNQDSGLDYLCHWWRSATEDEKEALYRKVRVMYWRKHPTAFLRWLITASLPPLVATTALYAFGVSLMSLRHHFWLHEVLAVEALAICWVLIFVIIRGEAYQ